MVRFRVTAGRSEQVYVFWAEEDFPVFRQTKDLRQISIQVDKLIDQSVGQNAKQMGTIIKNEIGNLLTIGKIKDVNDFMLEFEKKPAEYRLVSLEYDPKLSKPAGGLGSDFAKGVTGFGSRRCWGIVRERYSPDTITSSR